MYTPAVKNTGGSANMQYGSFETGKISVSGTMNTERLKVWGSISNLKSDGFRENNFYKRNSFITTVGWKGGRWSLDLLLLAIEVNGGIPSSLGATLFKNNPKAAAPNWNAIGGYKEYSKSVAGITLQNNISKNLINHFTLFGRVNNSFEKRPFNNLDDESGDVGFRNKLVLHNQKSDWVFGFENISDSYIWELINNELLINKNVEHRNHSIAFLLLYYRPLQDLNLNFGGSLNSIRYKLTDLFLSDGNSSGKRKFPVNFSPRAGINYSPGEILSIYASAGYGFSLPSPEETLLPEGNINRGIKPETGVQYELGTRLFLSKSHFELDAAIYRIDLRNLLVTKRLTEDQFTGINAGKTYHQGIELGLKKEWMENEKFPGALSSALSYFHSINRFVDFNDNGVTYNGNHLPGIPNQTLWFQLRWDPFKNLEFTSDVNYSGKQFMDDANKLDYRGHYFSSLKIKSNFSLTNRIMLSVYNGINNLTDSRYASMLIVNAIAIGKNEPRYYYPGVPRNFYFGIQFLF